MITVTVNEISECGTELVLHETTEINSLIISMSLIISYVWVSESIEQLCMRSAQNACGQKPQQEVKAETSSMQDPHQADTIILLELGIVYS